MDNEKNLINQPSYKISHLVSADKLKVYVRIELLVKDAQVDYKDVLNYLSSQNIVYGIKEEEIKQYCKQKVYSKEIIAAHGKKPVNGEDAQLIVNFDTSKEKKLKENEDGTIDFRDLNIVKNVKKDTVLCHIIPAKEGKDGINVYGETIRYKAGKNVSFNYGVNTYISKDGLQLLASTDGCIGYKNDKVYVENVYKVNNVDNTTGDINFVGSVIINGDVKAGFSVTAKGDIKIRGMVEGAFIESGGEVVISKGMNGMGKGLIYAKGNVTSKYIENALIVSEKTVYAEALINSEVKAGSIILRGSNAAIIGGTSMVENIIYAKTIGSKINPETNVIINLNKYLNEQKLIEQKNKQNQQIEKDLFLKNRELKSIEDKADLINSSGLDSVNKNTIQKQLLFMKIKINNEINEMKKQLSEIVPTDNIENHKIICKGIVYANTRITAGWMKLRIREDISYSKIFNDGSGIAIVPLNPADLDIVNY